MSKGGSIHGLYTRLLIVGTKFEYIGSRHSVKNSCIWTLVGCRIHALVY